jgi:hypothetical protein
LLRHAYGSAEDVPGLLRGLASADPVERETALDGMYGAVHHQGEVYDSTLACVPFLLALVASGDVADRADGELAAPVLWSAWTENPCTRRTITACLAALGPAGVPLHHLLRAERAARRRHPASPSGGCGSHDVLDDERLVRACGEVLGVG